jgi:glutamate-1-semialdehyde 2,1-aminomutase
VLFRSEAVKESGVAAQVSVAGSLMTVFFAPDVVLDYADAKKSDTARYAAFFNAMLDRGVFLPPSQFEALFVCAAHTEEDIERTIVAARESLKAIQSARLAD